MEDQESTNEIDIKCNVTVDGEYTDIECLISEDKVDVELYGAFDIDDHADNVLRRFIETYRSFEELWNTKHPDYQNKRKKLQAIDALMFIYREIKPGATHQAVRKKINTLRSNYWKTWNKVQESRRKATVDSDVLQPLSWVYHEMKFLGDELEYMDKMRRKMIVQNRKRSNKSGKEQPANPARYSIGLQADLSPLPSKHYAVNGNTPPVVAFWAEKYALLDSQQKLFAEKAINDLLFEASLGNLQKDSVKINQDLRDDDHDQYYLHYSTEDEKKIVRGKTTTAIIKTLN
ncbi:uncharacterized protein LOC131438573 [Malaya genurostris]|uniref:uncharacterized protein LOC131438573 n=1 Tax=Malaya genurostris TaxID=325434 RepID=UPI0026F4079E|nr:uncharacterized protein LOC131438573 [Malaya genurostris]